MSKLQCQSCHLHRLTSAGDFLRPRLSSTPFAGSRVAYNRQSMFGPTIGSSLHVSCRADMLEAAREQGSIAGVPVLVLKKSKARLFWEGAPTVYQGAIDQIISDSTPNTGDAALLVDANQKPLAWGVYNSESMFTLRILTWFSEVGAESAAFSLKEVVAQRIEEAVALRNAVGLPSPQTTIYRLINSEGDRLPGLIVDVFGAAMVAASSAAWVELNRTYIVDALRRHTQIQSVTWRPAKELLKLEGLSVQSSAVTNEGEGSGVDEPSSSHTTALENGILYRINQRHGQKTGFYADQRESREAIKNLSAGKRVLDLCCYTGGFAINAAAGGAEEVTGDSPAFGCGKTFASWQCYNDDSGVDSSAAAISLAEDNAGRLQQPCRVTFVREEVENFMRSAAADARSWDVVILGVNPIHKKTSFQWPRRSTVKTRTPPRQDEHREQISHPPKLAPNRGALLRARRKYESLNAAALKLVASGGLLMTCSCSGAVAQGQGLLPMVKAGETAARNGIVCLEEGNLRTQRRVRDETVFAILVMLEMFSQDAAMQAGRKLTLLRSAGAGIDHPLDPFYPEGRYLTNLLLRVR